jgi:hypothetical protein
MSVANSFGGRNQNVQTPGGAFGRRNTVVNNQFSGPNAWYNKQIGENAMASRQPETFNLHVPDAALVDLRERLSRTRFPDQAPGEPWAYGTDLNWMAGFVDYWRDGFDWRAQEARLNSFPQYKVRLQGIELHFMHVPGNGPDPHPLLLSHGWPGSVFEFLDLIPRLTDPGRFGADPADAFTVIVPSLPGYGLSFTSGQARLGIEAIADCFAELMTDVLGYRRFGAQGGDWGSRITARLGLAYPERMSGLHLNMMPVGHNAEGFSARTPEESPGFSANPAVTNWISTDSKLIAG